LSDDPGDEVAQRARLGLAIGARAEEIYRHTLERVYSQGRTIQVGDAYSDYRRARAVFGTLFLARALVSGIAMDPDELEWFARSGSAAAREGVPLDDTTRGQLHWRDLMIDVTQEEAKRLGTSDAVVAEVIDTLRRNTDATLVRLATAYDTQLREMNTQLTRASQFKSEFLAKMSHELRTPLTAIIGFADALAGGMEGELTPDQSEDVIQIQKSGLVLLELVNGILDLSKIESGQIHLLIQEIDLGAVVDQVIASLYRIAEGKTLKLTSELAPEVRTVIADQSRVREVLTNLVSNAIKFTRIGSVTIRSKPAGPMAEISVIDTGVGIPPESYTRIFEEFRQADDKVASEYGGTGLGLSIARKLVELQGGAIGVESRVGHGSRFWFTLPLPRAGRAQPAT
jgi:signal transduction histidine kinase